MAIGFKHGTSGGDLLDITIVSGTSRPSSPKENTIWVNSSNDVHTWNISPTEPPRVSNNKNLIVYPWFHTTRTENGLTFTDNKDGTVKVNGTATAITYFRMSYSRIDRYEFVLLPGTYHLSGAPSGGSRDTHYLCLGYSYDDWGSTKWVYDTGSGATFTVEKEARARVSIEIKSGASLSNATYKPQLERGSSATSFVKGDASGQIWVKTAPGGSVLMDALKGKNSIYVQPIEVCEYTANSGWVKRDAQVYQYGAWKVLETPWDGYYFKDGEQYTDITGGWTTAGWNNTGDVTIGTTIIASAPYNMIGQGSNTAKVGTAQPVDLTNAKMILFDSPKGNNGLALSGYLCVSRALSASSGDRVVSVEINRAGVGSVDVSGLSGEYYIYIFAEGAASQSAYADVRAIWIT